MEHAMVTIADLPAPPTNTVRFVIPAAVVLGLVKDALPIDATIIGAHFDAATDRVELTVQSDFFRQPGVPAT